jgi:ELWxxDGT repeat protein
MKKISLSIASLLVAAPLAFVAGGASASNTYTPTLVKQFSSENDSSFAVESIVPVNDSVAVVQLDNGDIWLTDGTSAGTTELNTLATEAGLTEWSFWQESDYIEVVNNGNGALYFWGYGSVNDGDGHNIWSFDGEAFAQITDIDFGGRQSALYFLDDELYVWATHPESEAYISLNHVDTSTGDVFEIAGGNDCDGEMDAPYNVLLVNGKIVFSNDGSNNCDYRMLSWDPSNPNTEPIDLSEAEGAHPDGFDAWESWAVFQGELYFAGDDTDRDEELWATDGTVAGTRLVKDINEGGNSRPGDDGYLWFTEFAGELYFVADDYAMETEMLYKTDGTSEGTVLAVQELDRPGDCIQHYGLVVGNSMFTDFDCEFYVTDGENATLLTPDLENGYGMCYNYCAVPVSFDENVFFTYFVEEVEGESNSLWVTDGTPEGTHAVTDFVANAIASQNDLHLVQLGSRLLFGVTDYEEQGGTGEMALYSIDAQNQPAASTAPAATLAKTGVNAEWLLVAGLLAVVAGSEILTMNRRRRTS